MLFTYTNLYDLIFSVKIMHSHFNERSGLKAPLISDDVYKIIIEVFI